MTDIETGINLDCYSVDPKDLMALWLRFRNHPVREGRLLFPDRPKGYKSATKRLANYAANKATAMSCRLSGDIRAAIVYETICERIYEGLPDYAKW